MQARAQLERKACSTLEKRSTRCRAEQAVGMAASRA
jgi:hypothetical protein